MKSKIFKPKKMQIKPKNHHGRIVNEYKKLKSSCKYVQKLQKTYYFFV